MKRIVPSLCFLGIIACEPQSGPSADPPAAQVSKKAVEREPAPPSGTLERKLYDKAAKFATDLRPLGPPFGGELEEGQRRDQLVVMRYSRCYRVIAVGGPEVEDLDLVLYDDDNVQVQRDFGEDPYPVLGLRSEICPRGHGAYRVQVGMFKGRGEYLARAYELGE